MSHACGCLTFHEKINGHRHNEKIRNMAQAVPGCRKSIPLQPGAAIFLYFCIVAMAISHKLTLKSHKANGPCCN
jgi:hypothetical protein